MSGVLDVLESPGEEDDTLVFPNRRAGRGVSSHFPSDPAPPGGGKSLNSFEEEAQLSGEAGHWLSDMKEAWS